MRFRPRPRPAALAVAFVTVSFALPLVGPSPAGAGTTATARPTRHAGAPARPTHAALSKRPANRPKSGATTHAGAISTTPSASSASPTTTGTGAPTPRHAKPAGNVGPVALTVRHDGKLIAGLAHAAAAVTGSIVDFSFSPGTITIHVGDTVTWTNDGQQPHTATANDGSFNTGILHHGQSASHTFNGAGTFAYYCLVHPYMKGTITVLASTTTTTPSSNGSTTHTTTNNTTTTTTTATTNSGSTLPLTGVDLGALLVCGVGLTGLGLGLRRRLSS